MPMRTSNRRTFLKGVAVGAVSLSGCTGSSGSNPLRNTATERAELKIAQLALSSQDDEPHTLAVSITESGETVFQVESEVGPAEYDNGEMVAESGYLVQGTPTEPGAYVIRASVDDREQKVFETSRVARSGVPCIPVDVEVDKNGWVGIWSTEARSYCE